MWKFIAGFPYVKSMIMGKLERERPVHHDDQWMMRESDRIFGRYFCRGFGSQLRVTILVSFLVSDTFLESIPGPNDRVDDGSRTPAHVPVMVFCAVRMKCGALEPWEIEWCRNLVEKRVSDMCSRQMMSPLVACCYRVLRLEVALNSQVETLWVIHRSLFQSYSEWHLVSWSLSTLSESRTFITFRVQEIKNIESSRTFSVSARIMSYVSKWSVSVRTIPWRAIDWARGITSTWPSNPFHQPN